MTQNVMTAWLVRFVFVFNSQRQLRILHFSTETLSGSLFSLDDVFQSQGRAKEAFDKVEKAAAAVEAPAFGGKLTADHPSKAVNSRGSTTGY